MRFWPEGEKVLAKHMDEIFSDVRKWASLRGTHYLEEGRAKENDIVLKSYKRHLDHANVTDEACIVKYEGEYVVSYIYCKDWWTDTTGADFEIVSGGVGYEHATIKIKPQKMLGMFQRGFEVTILILGRKEWI